MGKGVIACEWIVVREEKGDEEEVVKILRVARPLCLPLLQLSKITNQGLKTLQHHV